MLAVLLDGKDTGHVHEGYIRLILQPVTKEVEIPRLPLRIVLSPNSTLVGHLGAHGRRIPLSEIRTLERKMGTAEMHPLSP